MLSRLCFVLALAAACGRERADHPPKDPTLDAPVAVRAKADLYAFHAYMASDAQGWLYDKCDGLLFNSLAAVAGYDVDIKKATGDERGRWFRHPLKDCFELAGSPGGSASDISGDMLLGLAWYAWQTEDSDIALGVIDYGKTNGWRMGRGDVSRAVMRPPLIATYYALAKALGKDPGEVPPLAQLPELPATPTGYEADLQVLRTLLDAHVHCGATDAQLATLRRQAERQPDNAFFQAAYHLYYDGDQTAAYATMARDDLFPKDHLPTRFERCEGWLWHRDAGSDWAPCLDHPALERPHAGMDLRFALAVADNRLKRCA